MGSAESRHLSSLRYGEKQALYKYHNTIDYVHSPQTRFLNLKEFVLANNRRVEYEYRYVLAKLEEAKNQRNLGKEEKYKLRLEYVQKEYLTLSGFTGGATVPMPAAPIAYVTNSQNNNYAQPQPNTFQQYQQYAPYPTHSTYNTQSTGLPADYEQSMQSSLPMANAVPPPYSEVYEPKHV